jgi:alcohol dehydrogenase class IV
MRLRLPVTILFGRGASRELPRLLGELGIERPLLATDPGVAAAGIPARLADELAAAGIAAAVWDGVRPDPDESHAERCAERLRAGGHDGVVAVGGGSVLDAAKVGAVLAVAGGRAAGLFGHDRATRPGLPLIAAPTVAGSGSEVSSHAVLVSLAPGALRKKELVAGLHLLPRAAVVDPDLTLTLPPAATAHAALDALVHAVEAYLARRATPLTDAFALPAVPRIAAALPRVLARPGDAAAREALSLGCLFAGCAMANANAGAIHALGYPLTSRYGVPHGLANALMAAPALERTWRASPERSAELARCLGGETGADLAGCLGALLSAVGITDTLRGRGVAGEVLPALAREALGFGPLLENTPLALGESDLLAIYRDAYGDGARPSLLAAPQVTTIDPVERRP